MRARAIAAVLALLCVCAASPLVGGTAHAHDDVVSVPNDDAEMATAIAKARKSIDTFWAALSAPKPDEDGFALKVRIEANGQSEHFWLIDVERKGTGYAGTINNEPEMVDTVTNGQRYEFTDEQISDWMFMRNGKMVGNETMRPLLKHMPEQEAATYRNMLESP
jgi:uncharacterized protein YegJ (DUF2314 family)